MRGMLKYLILLVLLSSLVFGIPNADVSINPQELYETTSQQFNLTIDNLFKNEVIYNIELTTSNLQLINTTEFKGWNYNLTSNYLLWYNGDVETNSITLFQFLASAGLVSDDTTEDLSIILINETGSEQNVVLPIIILNDDTSPEVNYTIPENGDFIRVGIVDQLILINAYDPETGILNSNFTFWNCTNTTGNESNIDLICEGNSCSDELDLSDFNEYDRMCFEFIISNNALETTLVNGSVIFDGTAPSISLVSPENDAYVNDNSEFSFNATDNLAPQLDCEVLIDGSSSLEITAINNAITSASISLLNHSEGIHSWEVSCSDSVELSSTSNDRDFIIDRTAPEITLNSPSNNSYVSEGMISITITDNYELENFNFSNDLNISNLPEGVNTLLVMAEDKAGNVARKEFTFIVDRTSPTITIITPEENGSSDVHVDFVFDLDDNLATSLNCELFIDNTSMYSGNYAINETLNINLILAMDQYQWYFECEDLAGNLARTLVRNLNVTDLTGPDIISDIIKVARSQDYEFEINITDISGTKNVSVTFDGEKLVITNNDILYYGTIVTNDTYALGTYSLDIVAYDNLSNRGELIDEFELVLGYLIDFTIPSSVYEDEDINLSGTITTDDLVLLNNGTITLSLPDLDKDLTITNGTYEDSFSISDAGSYDIEAKYISSDNFEFSVTKTIEVNASDDSETDGGKKGKAKGKGKGTVGFCGDGVCSSFESCKKCEEDCGVCETSLVQERVVTRINPASLPYEEEEEDENNGGQLGLGSGTGLFSKIFFNFWAVLIFLIIIAVLAFIAGRKRKNTIYL